MIKLKIYKFRYEIKIYFFQFKIVKTPKNSLNWSKLRYLIELVILARKICLFMFRLNFDYLTT
jgi:hypothetical protein